MKIADFRVFSALEKRVFVPNHSYDNESHLQVYFHANQTHFHKKTFARGLILKQRQKAIRKWPIASLHFKKGCR